MPMSVQNLRLGYDGATLFKYFFLASGALILTKLFQLVLTPLFDRRTLPPGPPPLPLLGNLLDMPKERPWVTFGQWSERWGDIIHISLPGQPGMVILSSVKTATELLEKQSSNYSDRPVFTMGSELVGWDRVLGLTRYGPAVPEATDRFKVIRKIIHQVIGSTGNLERFDVPLESGTKKFLEMIIKDPEDKRWETLQQNIRMLTGSTALSVIYGYEAKERNDPFVKLAGDGMEQFSLATTPGVFLVNHIPLLKYIPSWFPGAGFKTTAKLWRATATQTADDPFRWVQTELAQGKANLSFVSRLIGSPEYRDVTDGEEKIKWAATSLYAGAADTTVSSIYGFVLAMVLYPDVLKRAQEELDSVVGADRLPTLADRPDLPYIDALTSEVLRWNPIAPLAIPHRAVEDNVYNGYFIPKDTLVFANIWKMSHNENVYSDPEAFKPERFMGLSPEPDPRAYVWGFGRRICPGRLFADSSVFIACAMMLAVFDIKKYTEDGVTITPSGDYTTGTISHPETFKCSIHPRSAKAASLATS